MNKTYRNIWNAATCTWTAVAETAKSHSKGSARAARQAVVALALGGAAVGGAFAADACTAADGTSGSLDTAGMCQAPVSSKGTRSIGTMAALDDAYIKVNGSTASSATTLNSIAIGNGAIAGSGGTTNTSQVAIGNAANAQGLSTVSIGSSSSANGDGAVAFGRASNANGTHATALGNQSSAQAQGAAAVGDAATVAAGATNSVAIGTQANVGANVTNSVALGAGSTATRNNAVSVGSTTQTRQITNLAAGTQNTDAVNLGQMNAALAPKVDDTYVKVGGTVAATASGNVANIAIGSGANAASTAAGAATVALGANANATGGDGAIALGTNATASGEGSIATGLRANASGLKAMALGEDSKASSNYGIALGAGTSAAGVGAITIGTATSAGGDHSMALGFRSSAQAQGANAFGDSASVAAGATDSVAIGTQASVGANVTNSVALGAGSAATRNDTISVGNATTGVTRQITNMAAGTEQTDAVNVSQLEPVVTALGGGAAIDPTSGLVTGPSYALANGGTQTTIGGALGELDKGLTTANTNIAQNAADITTINNKLSTSLDNKFIKVDGTTDATASGNVSNIAIGSGANAVSSTGNATIALGANANATGVDGAIAIGSASTASGSGSIATGLRANAGGMKAMALGEDSQASSNYGIALGAGTNAAGVGAITIGTSAAASGDHSMAMGFRSSAQAQGANAFGDSASVAAGATDSVAIGTQASVGANVTNSVALGAGSAATRNDTISVGNATTGVTRQITNMAAGTEQTDAVNVSQLEPVVTALGGGAAIDPTTGAVTGPKYDLANGGTQTTVGGALDALDQGLTTANTNITKNADDITTINNQLGDLASGTIGIVQQAGAGANITVGASNDGAAVDFKGTAGERKLIGVAAGDVSATSNEAVNGSQLHGVSESVAAAIGGTSTVNPDGTITAPSFTVGDGKGGTTTVNNVGDAVTNLDGRVTNNEGDIAKLADQIGSGTVGLVQQAGAGANLTVGANTDGAAVDFTGTAGERKLIGVAAGDVSATSNEAVNGSQLHGVSESVAAAIGGNSKVNPDGSISAPEFTVGDGKGGTTIVNNVGDVVTNLDGRVTSNEGDIAKLGDQLASGQIGLVQQDPASGTITVGAATGGSTVDFTGTGGARTLSGVANGVNDSDAVTIAQLKATGLIDYTGKEIAAVTYDDISLGSVTFGGSGGTALHNVAPGLISASSMDAVNGSQLYDLQQQFAQQYGQLSGQMDDLTNRVGDLEVGGGSGGGSGGGMGPGTGTGGDGSLVVGYGANASGENSSAVGQGAVASGNNGSAVGQGSVASGDNGSAFGQGSVASGSNGTAIGQGSAASGSDSTAVGQGAVASGDKGTAIGQGSSATGNGSVAIGSGSVADRDNSVSVGSEGHERQITNVKAGTADTDAVNVGQMNQRFGETNRMINDVAKNAYAGVAAAMAMPNLTPSQPGKTVVAVGAANYKSGSAVAAGATYRTRDGKWLMNGAVSVTSTGDAGVRAQVGYEF
ncbi:MULTISPECIES: ESPR-type extended signal peptide-containing protein [Burkholderia cepacia complex]|uniref:ESPR-type extended signal peptide-containing protein n=1 Tax=Burkholderia cepacia complex TaxID=87882 RepID=UPI00098F1174|nr:MULTISPECIES: ESPR-type extended signal peptide-containing protein [Burkholderia cepacia complex]AQT51966.1 hypothetical protein BHQ31_17805 [Burkholderia cenocepacia]MDN7535550.1 YadA-like family protein [Burkholderia orbicola]